MIATQMSPLDPPAADAPAAPMSREEHAQRMRELNRKRGLAGKAPPRRGWSMTEYQGAASAPEPPATMTTTLPPSATLTRHQHGQQAITSIPEMPSRPTTPELKTTTPQTSSSLRNTTTANADLEHDQPQPLTQQLPHRRPKAPPPRRSYSVTDYEPAPPNQPRPSTRLGLLDLPSELHYAILDHLDPIDAVCLGLAHPALYDIHRRKHPRPISLAARYSGPNDMEWAWRGAGPLIRSSSSTATPLAKPAAAKSATTTTSSSASASSTSIASMATSSSTSNSNSNSSNGNGNGNASPGPAPVTAAAPAAQQLAHMRVHGQVYCRKCGVSRCELHRHIREWFPGREYCDIKEVYCRPAAPGAKDYCYMSSPKHPNRCGRHGDKRVAQAPTPSS